MRRLRVVSEMKSQATAAEPHSALAARLRVLIADISINFHSVDTFSIRERLAELKKEIEEICREDRMYITKGRRRSAQDILPHDQRMLRMRQILSEIAKLSRLPET